jgi:hypothetical protein
MQNIATKPKEYTDEKPPKYEPLHFFRICSKGCPNCDKKRMGKCSCK